MKIAITGSNGFIGSHLVKNLIECKVKKFDREKHDLFEIESLKEFVEDTEIVVHLAGANRASDNEIFRTNVLGTFNLLEAIRTYNPNVKIIFASSFQVYGINRDAMEDSELTTSSIYGMSKKIAEELILFYSQFGVKYNILRLSNVYGPGGRPNYNSAIATLCYKSAKNETLQVNKLAFRDFIYVDDVVDIIKRCLQFNENEIFDVCSGELHSLQEVVEIINKEIKVNVDYNNEEDKYGLQGDKAKIETLLNKTQGVRFEEGINETLKWYLENVN